MSYSLHGFGRWRVLVTQPTATGYGSAAAELLNALHLARRLGGRVCFVRPRRALNRAIFDLESDAVRVLRGGSAFAVRAWWRLTQGTAGFLDRRRLAWVVRIKSRMKTSAAPRARKRRAKRLVEALSTSWRPAPHADLAAALSAIDFRREYAEAPVVARLRPADARRAERQARALGLDPSRSLVTVHVRESGYKESLALPERPTDVMRNADIANYRPALEHLVACGHQVVRIGDPTATPVAWPGVVDLARSPARTEVLELWCLQRSRFFVASDSGPYMVAILLGVPTLAVNVTALLGGDPLRARDRYLLKHVVDARSGVRLSLTEMLTADYLINFRAPGRYHHVENGPDEILAAVREMDAGIDQEPPPTVAQRRYDELLRGLASSMAVSEWRQGAGLAPSLYVGRGRVVDSFARAGFAREAPHVHG